MAISATFSVDGSTTVQAHPVNYGATVTFVIQSLTGIQNISWSIVGTSKSTQAALAISLSGTPSGATATVTMPSDPGDGLGRSFIMKLLVSNAHESAVHYAVFGKANSAGIIPVAAGEELYRNATHGYTDVFNQALNAIGGAAGSSGQLLYNNAGSIDGASGITIVGSETALAFGGTVSSEGLLRFQIGGFGSNGGLMISALNNAGTNNVDILRFDSTDKIFLGDPDYAAVVIASVKTGGTFDVRVNNGSEYSFSASALDMNGNNLQEVGDLDHDGTNLGFYGTAPTTKKTVTGIRASNAALESLLTQLAAYGLITDNTTAT